MLAPTKLFNYYVRTFSVAVLTNTGGTNDAKIV